MAMVTVVTVNFNGAQTLERTCRSITTQDLSLQWVVIDGGSTDGSQAIVRRYLRQDDIFVSERDRGISDAFNKGISLATGDALLFMNAGDEFFDASSLGSLFAAWDRSHHRWVAGGAEIVAADGRPLFTRVFHHAPADPMTLVRTNCQIVHQAVLADRRLFVELSGYDERWKVAMDYDLWIRWLVRGFAPHVVPLTVCRFHRGGASGNPMLNHREWQAIRRQHGISNGFITEMILTILAWAKTRIRGRYGRWLYRLKERLGVRW